MVPQTVPSSMDTNEKSSGGEESLAECSQSIAHAMARGAIPLMMEEDAAILERGVRDSCSTGQTPTLKPLSTSTDSTLPECRLPPTASSQTPECQMAIDYESQKDQYRLRNDEGIRMARLNLSSESSEIDVSNPSILLEEYESRGHDTRQIYRRCLSGDVRPRSLTNENVLTSLSPVSVAQAVRTSNSIDVVETDLSEKGFKTRSKSFDRRLNEAAQFAEAVGEMPPLSQNEVQVIIEETGSDDDEDSDIEVHIDRPILSPPEICAGASVDVNALATGVVKKGSMIESNSTQDKSIEALKIHRRQKSRPQWPLTGSPHSSISYLHRLPAGINKQNFVYKGISSNPPEITTRGISRGNYAQLHRKAWLEVSDKYHRYGKNLRLYYKRWESLGYPTNQFFDWLDSKGEAAGQALPNLEECPRSQLDADTVHYITNPEVTQGYAMSILPDDQGKGKLVDVDGDPVITGPDGWIFVLRDHTLYGAEKIASVSGHSKQRFHHSSFFGGKAVAAAGIIITDEAGYLSRLYPHSGHYRPGEADVQRMLFHLHDSGVNLSTFEVDTQQILHVTRHDSPTPKNSDEVEKKKKKIQSLHLKNAVYVACFLAHKARFIKEGVFDQIHTIRKLDVTNVTEALLSCDQGGVWARRENTS